MHNIIAAELNRFYGKL